MHAGWAALLTAALLGGCPAKQQEASLTAPPPTHAEVDAPPAPARPRAASRVRHELLTLTHAQGEAPVHHFTIPLADTQLAYVDLSYQTPLIDALHERDLVLNGGYWGYRGQERVIEGLLVVNDRLLAPKHKRGGVLEVRHGIARMVRGEDFTLAPDTTLALQCHPRLVDDGKLVPKLESQRRAARTALCVTDERSRLDAYVTESPITLPELALFLVERGCHEALNLDGGPSTAAVARLPEGVLTIARGEALPYGLGFTVR
ncbi:MAG TPA: phosphodiester glycosidase family protein [Polyangiales bacterium]